MALEMDALSGLLMDAVKTIDQSAESIGAEMEEAQLQAGSGEGGNQTPAQADGGLKA
jgi:hypothetical protein